MLRACGHQVLCLSSKLIYFGEGEGSMNHFGRISAGMVLMLAGMFAAGCGQQGPVDEGPVVRPIKMLEVTSRSIGRRLEYPGRVSPVVQSELSFEVPGQINYFPVKEGQKVVEGQVIARIDDRNYQADFAASQARLAAAKSDHERFTVLLEKQAVSQRNLESRQRNYEVAKADLAIAEKAVQDTELRAQFSGRIARKLVDNYQNVQAKQPVVLLQDDSLLEIKADIPERDLITETGNATATEISLRLNPQVSITSIPGRSFPAELKEVATAANPTTRTFEVTFSFEPPTDVRILPGMTARITVEKPVDEASSTLGFVIPSNAMAIDDDGSAFVWRIGGSPMQVESVQVTIGEMKGTQVTVFGGLTDGDLIAISGVNQLREGIQVRRMSNDG